MSLDRFKQILSDEAPTVTDGMAPMNTELDTEEMEHILVSQTECLTEMRGINRKIDAEIKAVRDYLHVRQTVATEGLTSVALKMVDPTGDLAKTHPFIPAAHELQGPITTGIGAQLFISEIGNLMKKAWETLTRWFRELIKYIKNLFNFFSDGCLRMEKPLWEKYYKVRKLKVLGENYRKIEFRLIPGSKLKEIRKNLDAGQRLVDLVAEFVEQLNKAKRPRSMKDYDVFSTQWINKANAMVAQFNSMAYSQDGLNALYADIVIEDNRRIVNSEFSGIWEVESATLPDHDYTIDSVEKLIQGAMAILTTRRDTKPEKQFLAQVDQAFNTCEYILKDTLSDSTEYYEVTIELITQLKNILTLGTTARAMVDQATLKFVRSVDDVATALLSVAS